MRANQIERMDLVGNVEGCDVILVDDMIDTAGTLSKVSIVQNFLRPTQTICYIENNLTSGGG